MPYPESPFDPNFDKRLLTTLTKTTVRNQNEHHLDQLLRWLCTSPKITSIRVNTLVDTVENVLQLLKNITKNKDILIESHSTLPNVIIIHNNSTVYSVDPNENNKEVIVDVYCAAAILRGAHIFAPGVIGMQSGVCVNDEVNVYVDVTKNCKKGFSKVYPLNQKIYLGRGIAKMTRKDLFGDNLNNRGVAIEMVSNISGCPNLDLAHLRAGSCIMQNLPSIICVQVLSPKPDEYVLDMCAAPGNKTTHIGSLMNNKGILIAIEKVPSKIIRLKETCKNFRVEAKIFQADSTKILSHAENSEIPSEPPFTKESFHRILLDAPCSALGKRPQFYNDIKERVLRSYVPLQRKLFDNAVSLLKVNGTLVYSTCTITLSENEGIVSWALNTYNCLKLIRGEPCVGSKGWEGTDLTDEQLEFVQRFDNNSIEADSVGFFIACFVKVDHL